MSYSCTDFTDSILDALEIDYGTAEAECADDDVDFWDTPSAQADVALMEIERLYRIEKAMKHALAVLDDAPREDWINAQKTFIARLRYLATEPQGRDQ